MVASSIPFRGIFVRKKTVMAISARINSCDVRKWRRSNEGEVGDALPLRAPEAHGLEEFQHVLTGALVDDLAVGEEEDVVEEVVGLRCGLDQSLSHGHLPYVDVVLADKLISVGTPRFPTKASASMFRCSNRTSILLQQVLPLLEAQALDLHLLDLPAVGSFSRAAHFRASSSSSSRLDRPKTSLVLGERHADTLRRRLPWRLPWRLPRRLPPRYPAISISDLPQLSNFSLRSGN
ncbi:unnamed protein product [Spirodela intermedia]|uniref:Uncharacterized protein n=1 Tax=Spirodela intermedia TaxID=51605 RepID=A0A7I8KHK4_SPIIN|nr:unnamed protein product [Spirodela intermedia]